MFISVSVNEIYIAHKRDTSDALYALVWSEHKRFQMLSECVSANSRIAQIIPYHSLSIIFSTQPVEEMARSTSLRFVLRKIVFPSPRHAPLRNI